MRAGLLEQRVTFETLADVQGPAWGLSSAPTTLATRWASLEPLSGHERFASQQTDAEVDHRVVLRFDSTVAAITPKHRMKMGSRTFDIISVINRGEVDKALELMVKEIL